MLKLSTVLQPRILTGGSGATLEVVNVGGEIRVKKSISGCKFKAAKLSKQYEWLAERQHSDKIVQVSDLYHEKQYCSYYMEFHPDHISLDDYLRTLDPSEARNTLNNIIDYVEFDIHGKTSSVKSRDLFLFYLKTKLHDKIQECTRLSPVFQKLLAHNEVIVNGVAYQNFTTCYLRLINSQKALKFNFSFKQSNIHGDLTFENILINPVNQEFVIIDPNLDNAISTPLIDFAKLNQSGISRYENMKRLQNVNQRNNEIWFDQTSVESDFVGHILTDILKPRMSEVEYHNLSLYEAIHFSRLLPYKLDLSPQSFPLFYARMIVLLNQYLNQIDP